MEINKAQHMLCQTLEHFLLFSVTWRLRILLLRVTPVPLLCHRLFKQLICFGLYRKKIIKYKMRKQLVKYLLKTSTSNFPEP